MDYKKAHSLIVAPARMFFLWANRMPLFKGAGVRLYEYGLSRTLSMLKAIPEVDSVYSKTDLKGDFVAGQSDIDLAVVTKELTIAEEVDFIKRYHKKSLFLRAVFPFMSNTEVYYSKEFRGYQAFRHAEVFPAKKHFRYWNLLYGKENRIAFSDDESQDSVHVIRESYENILLNIYESRLAGEKDFRRLYKFTLNIIRSVLLGVGRREPKTTQEYKDFLTESGFSREFAESLFRLPEKNFSCDENLIATALYCNMRLIEKHQKSLQRTGEVEVVSDAAETLPGATEQLSQMIAGLNKRHVKSIILSRIPFKDGANYLYVVLKSPSTFDEFKEAYDSLLSGIRAFSKFRGELRQRIKNRFQQDFEVFPLLVTERMVDNRIFIDGCTPMESLNIKANGKILYGSDLRLVVDAQHVNESFKRFVVAYSVYGVKNMLLPKTLRPEEKNRAVLDYLMAYRLLQVRKKACLSGVRKEYSKAFNDLGMDSARASDNYAFARRMLDEIWGL